MSKVEDHIRQLDEELVAIVQDFMLLSPLSWPKETMRDFFRQLGRKNMKLPTVSYEVVDCSEKIAALNAFIKKTGKDGHPALVFLRQTAESYLDSHHILQGAGTSAVSEFSKKLYGGPQDKLMGYRRRNIDVARYFLRVVEDYRFYVQEEPMIYSAAEFRRALLQRIKRVIPVNKDPIDVTIDSQVSARASAGPNYVKLRKGARFSESDLDQLFHHEVMIHTLTYINGRSQPVLKILGYNAPRTTATQEGLAVYAEYINSSIDLTRLKRVALRIIAINMAEQGADFVDLFRFFRKHGQNDEESYYSAMRIMRGGTPQGGIVFYKDNVYLRGLIEVGGFLKQAMHQGFIHDIALLFCGKLTTQDVMLLKPIAEQGLVADPKYMPAWAERSSELAAHLAISDLTERFNIEEDES